MLLLCLNVWDGSWQKVTAARFNSSVNVVVLSIHIQQDFQLAFICIVSRLSMSPCSYSSVKIRVKHWSLPATVRWRLTLSRNGTAALLQFPKGFQCSAQHSDLRVTSNTADTSTAQHSYYSNRNPLRQRLPTMWSPALTTNSFVTESRKYSDMMTLGFALWSFFISHLTVPSSSAPWVLCQVLLCRSHYSCEVMRLREWDNTDMGFRSASASLSAHNALWLSIISCANMPERINAWLF